MAGSRIRNSNVRNFSYPCDGRLTLQSGLAVATEDQADKGTVYFTPYHGNKIALSDGTHWYIFDFTEKSFVTTSLSSSTCYDIFGYISSNALALETLAWSTLAARSVSLAYYDGVLCKSGYKTKRYLGTLVTDASANAQDTKITRYLWNYYNRVRKSVEAHSSTDSTYTTTSWRARAGETSAGYSNFCFVLGVLEEMVGFCSYAEHVVSGSAGADAMCGIGLNQSDDATGYCLTRRLNIPSGDELDLITPLLLLDVGNGLSLGHNIVTMVECGYATAATLSEGRLSGEISC